MSKCTNCGRETLRTEDWACQWCGQPLPSGMYKSIKKTYRQLKEERLQAADTMQSSETETDIEPKQDLKRIKKLELEPQPEATSMKEVEPTQLSEEKPMQSIEDEDKPEEEKPEEEAKTEEMPAEEIIEETKEEPLPISEKGVETDEGTEEEVKEAEEAVCQVEEESRPVDEVEEIEEAEEQKEGEEPSPADLEMTVDEVFAAYELDQVAADERLLDKIIKVSGTVAAIEMKDVLDTYYIRLTGTEDDILESVQCMFDKKHGEALNQLEKGQKVIVQGRYNGSIIAVRMADCFLV